LTTFGERFRKERERRSLSLDDISNVTKISTRMLRAIEEGHLDQLPGGVFNKGFIRAYAKHLGFNDDEAINEYLEALHEAQVDAQAVWLPEHSPKPRLVAAAKKQAVKPALEPVKDKTSFREREHAPSATGPAHGSWKIPVAAALAVIAVGTMLWLYHSRRPGAENVSAAPLPAQNSAAARRSSDAPPPSSTAPIANAPSAPAVKKSDASSNDSVEETSDVSSWPARTSKKIPAAAAPKFSLVIRASENSWISVTVDGQPVSQETLIAPANTSLHATSEIIVKAGNSAGLAFLLDGKEIPPQGAEGEVKTLAFDRSGVRVLSPSQPSEPPH
jgi:cytoskeleton protein RodZ